MLHRTRRPAYTLLELVLVIALLAIVVAISFPSLDGMYGYHRLTAAVDEVRGAWASARAHAIEEGTPYRFSVVLGKGNFRLAPDSPEYWEGGNAPSGSTQGPLVLENALPKGVSFANGSQAGGAPSGGTDTVLPPGSVGPGQWHTLAVFLPDGTARDDVEIRFTVKGTPPAVLRLRALTGVATVQRGGGHP